MEDDDEFGDLYTDVLSTFPSSSSASHTHAPPTLPIHTRRQPDVADDSNVTPSQFYNNDSNPNDVTEVSCKIPAPNSAATPIRVLPPVVLNLAPDQDEKDFNFDNEENNFSAAQEVIENMEDLGSEPIIPGLETDVNPSSRRYDDTVDDWDSDSDDDLQIVLNENNHGHMGMEANGLIVARNGDDDEDGDRLVVEGDNDAGHINVEEQDRGEDTGQLVDGKEISEANNTNGGLITASKTGYSNYGYHPFHSQFKYVRPGVAPLPGGPPVSSGGGLGQVRPPVQMGNMVGRGRGDWRLPGTKGPIQKGFHPGFWGGNVQGRGLEFTLPSHKAVFDVDIDSFEEKPWKYPGVDVSDFFNFGLNEESWKEYCKQLEQLRLESTMQSKIRVYESVRSEQEYDPDLPRELAAASAGIIDTSAENVDILKVQGDVGDQACLRPPLPTGRAIQVETGFGERLPSVDTRLPRMRDSDAVIEIVLQDSMDEEHGATEYPVNDSPGEHNEVDVVDEDGDEYFDEYSRGYRRMDGDVLRKRSPIINSVNDGMQDEDRDKAVPQRASSEDLGSGGHVPSKRAGSPNEERRTKGRMSQQSLHVSLGDSALNRRPLDRHQEDSIDSVEEKHSVESSFDQAEGTQMPSLEGPQVPEVDVPSGGKATKLNEDIDSVTSDNTSKDKFQPHSSKQQKSSSQVEPLEIKEVNDGSEFKAPRSRDNSKAVGSSRDRSKWLEGADEIVENGRSTYLGDLKRSSRRKDHDGRAKLDRNYMLTKGRDEYYSHREWDPYEADHFHLKGEGTERRKERDYSDVNWQRREDGPHGRRIRTEDSRKHERSDVMLSSDKDEFFSSRKSSDNGSWRVYHEKDVGLRYRDKDGSSRSRHDVLDDRHMKRKKDDEHLRRDYVKKEESRKRDRDDISNHHPRVRDSVDDQNSSRLKDEVWMQREKDEWYRTKQSCEEKVPRREREDGRVPNRYNGHYKDTGRHGEQLNKRGRLENETEMQYPVNEDVEARGKQLGNEVRRSRHEKPSAQNDRDVAVRASVKQRVHEKHKDTEKSARDSEGHVNPGLSKRHRGEKGVVCETADMKGTSEKAEAMHDSSVSNPARERKDASSDDEHNVSKRGRSKLERWASHKDTDYDINSKSSSSSSSLKVKEISVIDKSGGSVSEDDQSIKKMEAVDIIDHQSLSEVKDVGDNSDALTIDGHLETYEKLKRRSERFKVPLTSDKDATTTTTFQSSEVLLSSQDDSVKMDRPPRKRRWISS